LTVNVSCMFGRNILPISRRNFALPVDKAALTLYFLGRVR
jgi:hypothetical protein